MNHIQTHKQKVLKAKKYKPNQIFIIKKAKKQKKWTNEEDQLLIATAEKFNERHWKEISKRFSNKNSLQCFSRFKRIRPGILKGPWKKSEDQKILDLVSRYGKAWSKISNALGTRNGKQIRDRFTNVLDPEIKKGRFTDEEDRLLEVLYRQYGTKWSQIALHFPKRTADMIKNRFHSSIKKRNNFDSKDSHNDSHIKSEQTTYSSSKSVINMKSDNINTVDVNNNDMLVDVKNDYSTITSKECDSNIYSQYSYFNCDIPCFESRSDFSPEEANGLIWNFDDYFTI